MDTPVALHLRTPPAGSRTRLRELHRQLRAAIVDGRLPPGARLPATRALALELGVSRNTTAALYDRMIAEGFLVVRPRLGTFVSPSLGAVPQTRARTTIQVAQELRARAAKLGVPEVAHDPRDVELDLRLGIPDTSQLRLADWHRLAGRALRRIARARPVYLDPAGLPELREALARHVSFARAVACEPDDIVATLGAQQAMSLLAAALVRPGRTVVAVEDPGYPATRAVFEAAGAIVRPVPVDGDGLCVAKVPPQAQIVCVTPSHQLPTGVPLSLRRRQALLELARARGAVIIEDDYDAELRSAGPGIDALQTLDRGSTVVYVGSFSKSLFPALRAGYAVAPSWLRPAMLAIRQRHHWHGDSVGEATLAAFIEGGHLARHLRRMRAIYAERRDILLAELERTCAGWLQPIVGSAAAETNVRTSQCGLHLAALLPARVRADPIVRAARERGVALDALRRFAVHRLRRDGLVLGFGACPAERIPEAVARIASLRG